MASDPDDLTIGPSAAVRTPGSGRFAPGAIIAGRYRLVALLGRGGMGEVYRAEDLTLDNPVALKFLPEGAVSTDHLAQFHNELRIARQVSHKNVCRLYDLGEADGRRFLTMEYVDGEDLASLVRRIGRIPQDKGIDIARQICAGLAAAHERGVLHRDLKPANVMLDGDGNVRITDFGLAVAAGDAMAVRAGTPQYMAPELLNVGDGLQAVPRATVKSDIYALGLVLFEIFTGKRAHDAKTLHGLKQLHESGAVTTPSSVIRDLDPAVERVIMRCLERDPARRPGSALAVAAALPGGNPLADALAAGETPSPDLLAAAGESEALAVAPALATAVASVVGLLVFAAASAHTSIVGRVPLDKPTAVLIDRAEQIAKSFGYHDPVADEAHGATFAAEYLEWLIATARSPRRWDVLSTGTRPAVLLWHRTSPREMLPLIPFSVKPNDPPLNDSGMRLTVLDTLGRLQQFQAVPPQVDAERGPASPPRWSDAFDSAGLTIATFKPSEPQWTPPAFADTRAAWEGAWPDRPDVPLRIEAAAYRGRIVSFYTLGPWSRPTRMQPPQPSSVDRMLNTIVTCMLVLMFVGAMILARYHLRVGRADRRGAARLTLYVAVGGFLDWAIASHHVPTLTLEFSGFMRTVSVYLTTASLIWVMYIALEPYVRRFWPDSLLGWSRLLAGHIRDPRVGRDTLAGVAFGIAIVLIELAKARVPPLLGYDAPTPFYGRHIESLFTSSQWLSRWIEQSFNAIEAALLLVLIIVVLRLLLRRVWLSAAVVFLIATLFATNNMTSSNTGLIWVFPLASGALLTLVAYRFGLLPLGLAIFVWRIAYSVPFTLDVGRWSATPSNWTLTGLIALIGFGVYAARAGQPLFGTLAD